MSALLFAALPLASALQHPARPFRPRLASSVGVTPPLSRRQAALGAAVALIFQNSIGEAIADEGLTLEDLPPKAQQAYNQYWPAMQLAGDFYVFELRELVGYPGRWDQIGALTETTNIGSAASVSKLDREFLTPMRILALAFPPDAGGEDMQQALNAFQTAMFKYVSP